MYQIKELLRDFICPTSSEFTCIDIYMLFQFFAGCMASNYGLFYAYMYLMMLLKFCRFTIFFKIVISTHVHYHASIMLKINLEGSG